jgi:hypothetical protein
VPHTSADPRAVVVVHLHTYSTGAAVEGSGWSENLAAMTIRHFVMPIKLRHRFLGSILV